MYNQQDRDDIKKRIIKYVMTTALFAAASIAGFVAALINRWEIGAIVCACLIFCVICYGWIMYIWPCIRYSQFLRDMTTGLTREIAGSVVEISQQEDLQDGVRVLQMRVQLDKEDDERIVYLNASKQEFFPKVGDSVRLNCFGRHIKEVM